MYEGEGKHGTFAFQRLLNCVILKQKLMIKKVKTLVVVIFIFYLLALASNVFPLSAFLLINLDWREITGIKLWCYLGGERERERRIEKWEKRKAHFNGQVESVVVTSPTLFASSAASPSQTFLFLI